MASIEVPGHVHVGHISTLLGGVPVEADTDDDGSVVRADVSESALRDAIAAHDPAWINPDTPAAPSPSLQEQIDALQARLDKAAAVPVTGDAAVLRDSLKDAQ